jgi:hypothetical protein
MSINQYKKPIHTENNIVVLEIFHVMFNIPPIRILKAIPQAALCPQSILCLGKRIKLIIPPQPMKEKSIIIPHAKAKMNDCIFIEIYIVLLYEDNVYYMI